MSLKTARRLTGALSIASIVLAVLEVFSFIILLAYIGMVVSDPSLDDSILSDPSLAKSSASSIASLVAILTTFLAGIFGVRGARRPSRARRIVPVAAVMLVSSAVVAVFDIIDLTQGSASMSILGSGMRIAVAAGLIALGRKLAAFDAERVAQGLEEEDPLESERYLGTLRLIEFLFIVNILFTLAGLIMESRDVVVYDFTALLSWANLVFESLALWMIVRRYSAARPWVLFYTVFNIASGCVHGFVLGDFSLVTQVFSSLFDIFLFLYFLTSRRIRKICVNKFSFSAPKDDDYEPSRGILDIKYKGWPYIRNLIMYYCFFSLAGHWMEAAMCQLIRLGLVDGEYDPTNTMLWRDWFYPFPMEGLAVVFIALFLFPFKNWLVKRIKNPVLPYVVSFFANMLLCVAIEFTMGLFVNDHYQLWDYRTMPFNFMGQVCLQNALAFGVAASVIAWIVYPLLDRALSHVPNDVMNIAFVVCVAAYAIPQTLYLIDPPEGVDQWLESYETDAATTEAVATAAAATTTSALT